MIAVGGASKVLSESQLIDLWEKIDARVGELLEGCEPLPQPSMTFNPASDIPFEEQKLVSLHTSYHIHPSYLLHPSYHLLLTNRIDAMGRIRMLLIDAEHAEAVALYRAARYIYTVVRSIYMVVCSHQGGVARGGVWM